MKLNTMQNHTPQKFPWKATFYQETVRTIKKADENSPKRMRMVIMQQKFRGRGVTAFQRKHI